MTQICFDRARSACAALLLSTAAAAQCQLTWQPGAGTFGPDGNVSAIVELPNGDLVAAGSFQIADRSVCTNVARYDGATWQPMGEGLGGFVTDLVLLPNGDLMASGGFAFTGSTYIGRVARWNGSAWESIGADVPGTVSDLEVAPNGDLIIVGSFSSIGNVPANDIASWDGATFSAIGDPGFAGAWNAKFLTNGELCLIGDAPAFVPDIVRWNGTAWLPFAGIQTNQLFSPRELVVMGNGDLVIRNGLSDLMRYDGTSLQPLPAPLTAVLEIQRAANGDLLAGGFSASGLDDVQRFDGTSWTSLGDASADGALAIATTASGALVVGSNSPPGSSSGESTVRQQSGAAWQQLGVTSPTPSDVNTILRLPNGDVIAAGAFLQILGVPAANIARWDGTAWQPLGFGVDGPVYVLKLAPDGSLLVGGDFQTAGGAPAPYVARWSDGNWSTVGGGLDGPVRAIAQNDQGVLAAYVQGGTNQPLRRFENGTWSNVPGNLFGAVIDVVALATGDFAAIGSIFAGASQAVGGIRFDTALTAILPGTDTVQIYATGYDERGTPVFVTTTFGQTSLAVIDQDTMVPFASAPGNSPMTAVTGLPDGGYAAVIGGSEVQRFDGTSWSPLAGPLRGAAGSRLAASGHGDLFAISGTPSGTLLGAGTAASIGLARAETGCRPAVTSFGAGCIGSNGPVTLSSDDQPWPGAVFEAEATGMATNALALVALGVGTAAAPLPFGQPGCSLFGTPVVLQLALPQNGSVDATVAIPSDPALSGQVVTNQVLGLELDASLALTGLTGSNALLLTIGGL